MKKPDLAPYLPLGVPAAAVAGYLRLALGLALLVSFRFLFAFASALQELYYTDLSGRRLLTPGAVMPAFSQLLPGVFWGFWAVAALMPAAAWGFTSPTTRAAAAYTPCAASPPRRAVAAVPGRTGGHGPDGAGRRGGADGGLLWNLSHLHPGGLPAGTAHLGGGSHAGTQGTIQALRQHPGAAGRVAHPGPRRDRRALRRKRRRARRR